MCRRKPRSVGFVQMEIARIDPSFSTFIGVHNGLAMGSIYIDDQKSRSRSGSANGTFR